MKAFLEHAHLKEDWLLVAAVGALNGHLGDCVSVFDLPDGLVLGRDLVILLTPAIVILASCKGIINDMVTPSTSNQVLLRSYLCWHYCSC